ncbi:MAG: Ig-like domain-containing protein [Coriobacteriia bacterium]|nr:Ig-like domain-containing protein [Coriobacteriia bacterium]
MKRVALLLGVTTAFMLVCAPAFAVTPVSNPTELRAALVNGARIELTDDIELDYQLLVKDLSNVVIDGDDHKITASADFEVGARSGINNPCQLISVVNSEVTFTHVQLLGGSKNSHILNVSSSTPAVGASSVTLSNVILDRSQASAAIGGAPLVINASQVVVKNNLNVVSEDPYLSTWYGIGISSRGGDLPTGLTFAADASTSVAWTLGGDIERIVDADASISSVINPDFGGVTPGPEGHFGPEIPATTVTVEQTALSMYVGENVTVGVSVLPENTSFPQPSYSSNDAAIASVDDEGHITAFAPGSTMVHMTVGKHHLAINVDVMEPATLTLDPMNGDPVKTITVPVGKTLEWLDPSAIAVSEKPGHTLMGWWTAPKSGVLWDWAHDVVVGNMTLYAHWVSQTPGTQPTIPPTGDEIEIDPWIWVVLGLGIAAMLAAIAYWWWNRRNDVEEVAGYDAEYIEEVIDETFDEMVEDEEDFFDIELI